MAPSLSLRRSACAGTCAACTRGGSALARCSCAYLVHRCSVLCLLASQLQPNLSVVSQRGWRGREPAAPRRGERNFAINPFAPRRSPTPDCTAVPKQERLRAPRGASAPVPGGRGRLYGHRCRCGAEGLPTEHLPQDPRGSVIYMQA